MNDNFPPRGIFYDGDVTVASPSGGLELEIPFPQQPQTQIFRQKFQQHYDYWKPLALGSSPLASGMMPAAAFDGNVKTGRGPFLVGESELIDIGGGIREWTRTWAHVPGMIYEWPALNYLRQKYSASSVPWNGFYDTWGNYHGTYRTYTAIEEWTEPTTAIVHKQFIRVPDTLSPAKMLPRFRPLVPFRIVKFNDERGKEHVFQLGTQGVADASQIERWMGDIWQVINTYVQPTGYGPAGGIELAGNGFFGFNLPPAVIIAIANGTDISWTDPPGWIGGVGGDT
jgi:hypothetical protein